MGPSRELFPLVFLLLLLVATEMAPAVAQARMCWSPSQKFRGPCVRDANCESVCQSEVFTTGECRGFRRRCFCGKPCPD